MSILSTTGIVSASNADPAIAIDPAQQTVNDLMAVKHAAADIIAEEKAAYQKLTECQRKIEQYEQAAKKAVLAGNDGDARKLLETKDHLTNKLSTLQNNYRELHESAAELTGTYHKLKNSETLKDTPRVSATNTTPLMPTAPNESC